VAACPPRNPPLHVPAMRHGVIGKRPALRQSAVHVPASPWSNPPCGPVSNSSADGGRNFFRTCPRPRARTATRRAPTDLRSGRPVGVRRVRGSAERCVSAHAAETAPAHCSHGRDARATHADLATRVMFVPLMSRRVERRHRSAARRDSPRATREATRRSVPPSR